MSKSFNINMDNFNQVNNMDSIYAGNTPVEPVSTPAPKKAHKETTKKDFKKNNGINKKDNYCFAFKIDSDLEDYIKNILWINRKTKTEYINDLIRDDMKKRLELKQNASNEEIQAKWGEYKRVNNI